MLFRSADLLGVGHPLHDHIGLLVQRSQVRGAGDVAADEMCIRDRPEALLAANQEHCIRMPMRDTCRSLNLSNSVAVGVYEVLRQWDFPELLDHGHLRDYQWK